MKVWVSLEFSCIKTFFSSFPCRIVVWLSSEQCLAEVLVFFNAHSQLTSTFSKSTKKHQSNFIDVVLVFLFYYYSAVENLTNELFYCKVSEVLFFLFDLIYGKTKVTVIIKLFFNRLPS